MQKTQSKIKFNTILLKKYIGKKMRKKAKNPIN